MYQKIDILYTWLMLKIQIQKYSATSYSKNIFSLLYSCVLACNHTIGNRTGRFQRFMRKTAMEFPS